MILMNVTRLLRRTALLAASVSFGVALSAATIPMSLLDPNTYGYEGTQREGWLTSSTGGYVVTQINGTPGAANVGALFGDTWAKEGELTANGSNDLFSVNLDVGDTWGNGPLDGTWTIDSSFWLTYGRAVITMHVGNGAGDPDWFLWEVSPNNTSGTFHYARLSGGGGGLSNLFLWGAGEPAQVPDGGVTAILLGAGLLLAGLFRRKAV